MRYFCKSLCDNGTLQVDPMGIKKFTSFEEAEQALWEFNPDSAYFSRLRDLFALAEKLYTGHVETGIRKYRSLEERVELMGKRS